MTFEAWVKDTYFQARPTGREMELMNAAFLAAQAESRAEVERLKAAVETLSNNETVKGIAAGIEDIRAGRTKPLEEVRESVQLRIENDKLKAELAMAIGAAEEAVAAEIGKYVASGEWGMVHQVLHKLTTVAPGALERYTNAAITTAIQPWKDALRWIVANGDGKGLAAQRLADYARALLNDPGAEREGES